MKSLVRSLSSFTLVLLLTFASGVALACSCGDKNLKQIVDESRHIFVAKIISAQENSDAEGDFDSVRADFEIIDVVKGEPDKLDHLYSGFGFGDCGIPFLVGMKMLVYTDDGTVSMCGASRSFGLYDDESQYIEKLKSYVTDGVAFDFDNYPAVAGVWISCDEQD